nr:MAG TPA: hypothetical protein [Caudoviricetes sp.]
MEGGCNRERIQLQKLRRPAVVSQLRDSGKSAWRISIVGI